MAPIRTLRLKERAENVEPPPLSSFPLPIELVDLILLHISRDDAGNLRLVCKDLEDKVSPTFFRSIVVPFNSELLAMVTRDIRIRSDEYGVPATAQPPAKLHWMSNQSDDQSFYRGHGYKVFSGFGRHIRHFGMSFEVSEDDLRTPRSKAYLDTHVSFHGKYLWPPADYRRFEDLSSLEQSADDTSLLRDAMAHLTDVRTLGLSLNNGLGWQSGKPGLSRWCPSHRPPIFGKSFHHQIISSYRSPEDVLKNLPELPPRVSIGRDVCGLLDEVILDVYSWPRDDAMVEHCHMEHQTWATAALIGVLHGKLTRSERESHELRISTSARHKISLELYQFLDPNSDNDDWLSKHNIISLLETELHNLHKTISPVMREDLLKVPALLKAVRAYLVQLDRGTEALQPSDLTQIQEEWLLEADWAQRAFFQSYVLSMIDNQGTFSNVTSFNFACLPSSYLVILYRQAFWTAIPNVTTLILYVLPEWRRLSRTDGGIVEETMWPSESHSSFFVLLNSAIRPLTKLTTLEVGWFRPVEDAISGCARKNYLPAPLCLLEQSVCGYPHTRTYDTYDVVQLPSVRHLTLANCYIHPSTLKAVVRQLQNQSLTSLKLQRVFLTAINSVTTFRLPRRYQPEVSFRENTWSVVIHDIAPREGILPGLVTRDTKAKHPRKVTRMEFKECGYAMSGKTQKAQNLSDVRAALMSARGQRSELQMGAMQALGGWGPQLFQQPVQPVQQIPAQQGMQQFPQNVPYLTNQGLPPAPQNPQAVRQAQQVQQATRWLQTIQPAAQPQLAPPQNPPAFQTAQQAAVQQGMHWHNANGAQFQNQLYQQVVLQAHQQMVRQGMQQNGMQNAQIQPPPMHQVAMQQAQQQTPHQGMQQNGIQGTQLQAQIQAPPMNQIPMQQPQQQAAHQGMQQPGAQGAPFQPPPMYQFAMQQAQQQMANHGIQQAQLQADALDEEVALWNLTGDTTAPDALTSNDTYLATLVSDFKSRESRHLADRFGFSVSRILDRPTDERAPLWCEGDIVTFSGVLSADDGEDD